MLVWLSAITTSSESDIAALGTFTSRLREIAGLIARDAEDWSFP